MKTEETASFRGAATVGEPGTHFPEAGVHRFRAASLRSAPGITIVFVQSPLWERGEMPTQSLPAASLRPADRLPAARLLLRVASYLICLVLSAIAVVISSVKSSFLPALRDAPNRLRQLRSADA